MKRLIVLLAATLLTACGGHRPPTPPQPPPSSREVHISVWGDGALAANQVTVAMLTPEPTDVPLAATLWSDSGQPRLKVVLPDSVPYGWGAHLHIETRDYAIYHERVILAPDLEAVLAKKHGRTNEYGSISVNGDHFINQLGQQWHGKGATGFLLYELYQRGDDVTPYLNWMVAHDRTVTRVFPAGVDWVRDDNHPMAPWCPVCLPSTRNPDLSKLPAFIDLLAEYGIRVEFSIVTGAFRSFAEWRTVVQQVYDASAGKWNVFAEIVNEPWNGWATNAGLDPQALVAGIDRHGILSAYGYEPQWVPGTEDARPSPHLDYQTWHSPRDAQHFPRNSKDAMNIRAAQHIPVVDDEPWGFANFTRAGGGARSNDGAAMAAHFATCAVFADWCTWHFEQGLWGLPPASGTTEAQIADRLQPVAAFYPPNADSGAYTRAGLGDFGLAWSNGDSLVNHAYGLIVGNTQWVVLPLPRAGWAPQPVNGWRINTIGPELGMLSLVK